MTKEELIAQVVERCTFEESAIPELTEREKGKDEYLKKHSEPRGDAMGCSRVCQRCRRHNITLKQYSRCTCTFPVHQGKCCIVGGIGVLGGRRDERVRQLSPAGV